MDKNNNKYGQRFLIYIIAFFITFMTVDAFFVYKAMTTYTGAVDQIHGK